MGIAGRGYGVWNIGHGLWDMEYGWEGTNWKGLWDRTGCMDHIAKEEVPYIRNTSNISHKPRHDFKLSLGME